MNLTESNLTRSLLPLIEGELVRRVENNLIPALQNNKCLKVLFQLDIENKNDYYQNMILNLTCVLMNSKKEEICFEIANGISRSVVSNKLKNISLEKILQIGDADMAFSKLNHFIPSFLNTLNAQIEKFYLKEIIINKEKSNKNFFLRMQIIKLRVK